MMAALFIVIGALAVADEVRVVIISSKPNNPKVTRAYEYSSHVTLSIEKDDGTLIPSGWSTRKVFTFSQLFVFSVVAFIHMNRFLNLFCNMNKEDGGDGNPHDCTFR